ncbi:hypothetical protein [Streptomyces sp. CRN 30]|uniref:hypothetical protein n=1 Tax=Streptomyces sp. CRN 30 TaxID=3075613 RepID=UPI002A826ECC|nr:hypothetical protein [Streptomyces sp. CRN 30]
MFSTRRLVTAVSLAAGITGLAAMPASAADAGGQETGGLRPTQILDSLAVSDLPAEYRDQVLRPSDQLRKLKDLNQLRQLTDMAAPVTGLLPGIHT